MAAIETICKMMDEHTEKLCRRLSDLATDERVWRKKMAADIASIVEEARQMRIDPTPLANRVDKLENELAIHSAAERSITVGPELPDPSQHHCNDLHCLTANSHEHGKAGFYFLRAGEWKLLWEDTTWRHCEQQGMLTALDQRVAKLESADKTTIPDGTDAIIRLSNRVEKLEEQLTQVQYQTDSKLHNLDFVTKNMSRRELTVGPVLPPAMDSKVGFVHCLTAENHGVPGLYRREGTGWKLILPAGKLEPRDSA